MSVAHHTPLLLIGPMLVALLAYLIAPHSPVEYKSTSLLRINAVEAKSMETLVTSPAVADAILSKYAGTGDGPESHARFLTEHLRIVNAERPGGPAEYLAGLRPEYLVRLDVTHPDPRTAQLIGSEVIDAWLDSTRPRGSQRTNLEAELDRNKAQAAANSKLIDELQSEATKLLAPNSLAGELATPISALISKRDQNLAAVISLEHQLQGVPREVIISPPHLPRDPIPSGKLAIAILFGAAAIPVFLALILLGRYFAPGLSAYEVLSGKYHGPK